MTIRNIVLGLSFCFVVLKLMGLITLSWWFLPLIYAIAYKLIMRAAFGSLMLVYLSSDDDKQRNEIGQKLETYVHSRTGVKVKFTYNMEEDEDE